MWDVWNVGCSRCGMFGVRMLGMWDVRDVGYWRYGIFGIWDMGCGKFTGMWDIEIQKFIFCQSSMLFAKSGFS